ncbi:MAG: ribose-phosphate pyrophosphokinase [Oscillospiraceae bacterium]|nr:ribose-phosphate pyrophosphokinase [Oscillospiraceae bacterium]
MGNEKRVSSCFEPAPVGPLGLLALPGCTDLAEKVSGYLDQWREETNDAHDLLYTTPAHQKTTSLIEVKCPRFSNGEGKAVITDSVRGYDVFLFCDVGNFSQTYKLYNMQVPMSPDDHYQNLKRTISAIGGKARRITVIMPMLYEGRQHRRSMRESLDSAMALQELVSLGVSNIVTFDAHDPRIVNAVPFIGFENILPTYQMLKALLRDQKDLKIDKEHMMIISPDEGAMDRNIYYSTVLGLELGMFYKRRDFTTVVNGRNPIIAHEFIGSNVEGKDIIVVDDMISSGDSILDVAKELKKRKAGRIFLLSTFGLFTSGFEVFDKAYEEGLFTRVLSTNLTYSQPELLSKEWFVQVDCSKYLAYIIATLNHDSPVNSLLDPLSKIKTLLENYPNKLPESQHPGVQMNL